jgi:hypothetical protein
LLTKSRKTNLFCDRINADNWASDNREGALIVPLAQKPNVEIGNLDVNTNSHNANSMVAVVSPDDNE